MRRGQPGLCESQLLTADCNQSSGVDAGCQLTTKCMIDCLSLNRRGRILQRLLCEYWLYAVLLSEHCLYMGCPVQIAWYWVKKFSWGVTNILCGLCLWGVSFDNWESVVLGPGGHLLGECGTGSRGPPTGRVWYWVQGATCWESVVLGPGGHLLGECGTGSRGPPAGRVWYWVQGATCWESVVLGPGGHLLGECGTGSRGPPAGRVWYWVQGASTTLLDCRWKPFKALLLALLPSRVDTKSALLPVPVQCSSRNSHVVTLRSNLMDYLILPLMLLVSQPAWQDKTFGCFVGGGQCSVAMVIPSGGVPVR